MVTKTTVKTDRNLIFSFIPPDYEVFYSSVSRIIETNRLNLGHNNIIRISVAFRGDTKENLIERSYEKIDNMVANVGTMVFALYFSFKLFLFFFKKGNLSLNLIRKLYKFKFDENEKLPFKTIDVEMQISHKKADKSTNKSNKLEHESISNIISEDDKSKEHNLHIIPFGRKIDVNDSKNENMNKSEVDKEGHPKEKKEGMMEMSQNAYRVDRIEGSNEDEIIKFPGLKMFEGNITKDSRFKKLSISKVKLFFFACCRKCFKTSNVDSYYYYMGMEFLNHDMNVETVIKKLIEFEALKKLLLKDKYIRMLASYQKRNICKETFTTTLKEIRNLIEFSEIG